MIAKSGDAPIGDAVYNGDGTDQTVTQKVKTGKSASYDIDIESDAITGTDAITGDAGNNEFKVKYDDAGDVTAA